MPPFFHSYAFDPAYGHTLDSLQQIPPAQEPADFVHFWQSRYERSLAIDPQPRLTPSAERRPGMRVWDIAYRSTNGFPIAGWLLEPLHTTPKRGFVIGHGYGFQSELDFPLPSADAVYLLPCFRGLCRSSRHPLSSDPMWHVLHDIQSRDDYVLGGCVEDIWTAVTALLQLHPQVGGQLGYMGISFGGGIGAMALAWDERMDRGHLNVPSFGQQPLRLQLPSIGSAAAVQRHARDHSHVIETLAYYDASTAARHIRQPMHLALALFDPAVAPPGQFSIYNALQYQRRLFVLEAGHFGYPNEAMQAQALLAELKDFFDCDES